MPRNVSGGVPQPLIGLYSFNGRMSSFNCRCSRLGLPGRLKGRIEAVADEAATVRLAEVTKELARRQHTGRIDTDDTLDHGDAGQWRESETITGSIGPQSADQNLMALSGIESGEVEIRRQGRERECDPMLERIADDPRGTVADGREAVTKAAL